MNNEVVRNSAGNYNHLLALKDAYELINNSAGSHEDSLNSLDETFKLLIEFSNLGNFPLNDRKYKRTY